MLPFTVCFYFVFWLFLPSELYVQHNIYVGTMLEVHYECTCIYMVIKTFYPGLSKYYKPPGRAVDMPLGLSSVWEGG